MDQAATLRRLMQQRKGSRGTSVAAPRGAQVITVASGKGGVGKSCLVANLGTYLARQGHRVLLVDGDLGLANLDILLDVNGTATLEDVLDGQVPLQSAIVGVEQNLWLIPSASGLMELRKSDPETRGRLMAIFERLPWEMDFIIVDCGAGIQENVLSLHSPAFKTVVMLTPEPTALTDVYGLVKLLRKRAGIDRASVIVNQVTDGREGQQIFQKLKEVANRFIDVELDYLGHWQRDEKVTQAVMKRKILLDLDEGCPSRPSLELLAKRLRMECLGVAETRSRPLTGTPLRTQGNTAGFWKALLGEVKA